MRSAASGTARLLARAPYPTALAVGCLAVAPIAALVLMAVFGSDDGATAFLLTTRLPAYVAASVALTALTAVGVAVLGAGLAWIVSVYRFPGRAVFDWALMLPLAAPAYVLAFAYADLTGPAGPLQSELRAATGWETGGYVFPEVRGLLGAAFVFTLALYPYVYALARRAFAHQAHNLIDAGRTLGRGPVGVFFDVALPLARPALAAGCALALMEALADYGAVAHLGVPTLTAGIVRAWASSGEPVAAARLAVVLFVFCLALFAIERRARGGGRTAVDARGRRAAAPRPMRPAAAWTASGICAAVLVFALAAPAAHLLGLSFEAGPPADLARTTGNSVLLAALAAGLIAAAALALAAAARQGRRLAPHVVRIASAGYAVPGAVAAMGVLAFLGTLQRGADAAWGGLAPIALIGGIPALLLAYQTRFAAAALGPITSALEKITPALDAAARSLGAGPDAVMRRVHAPIAASGVAAAALLVYVEVLKELPATMILRPFNFDTLAVVAHAYAADERLPQAAAPALTIVLVALPAMIVAARLLERRAR